MKRLNLDREISFKVTSPRTRVPGESCSASPSIGQTCQASKWPCLNGDARGHAEGVAHLDNGVDLKHASN